VGSNDVRSEGMSYGMMITVQLGQKQAFDRLWKWSKTHMQHASGPWKGYFAWQCEPSGKALTKFPASDGEEYFAMALLFADGRWGSGKGIYNYRAEADAILHHMLHKERDNGGIVDNAHNMFDRRRKQVVFVPNGDAAKFTDASYHLPAFYELWARWGKTDRAFWKGAASESRKLFRKATHPKTGLPSDYCTFDGRPMKAPWDPNSAGDRFASDSLRVIGNMAMDYAWFGSDPWQVKGANRMLDFFSSQKPDYVSGYSVDGKPTVDYKSAGHIAMNAVGTLAATTPSSRRFVRELWEVPIPSGQWRYYDGMLYMFGLLHASGQYRIWKPRS
jgi:oligosaccharide reducing-end xylanase